MADRDEPTYSVGAVARATGLSPDVIRAWERRYGVVDPLRSEGGTRRYRPGDLERLQALKAAVDAGHRVGDIAHLAAEELDRLAAAVSNAPPRASIEEVIAALDRLDGARADLLISSQLAALGPTRFAKEFALPLVEAIGEAWQSERLCVASEHLGSSLLRSLLGSALRPTALHRDAPRVVFGTPPEERHEIGLLIAALTALGAGVHPIYLGADLPLEELVRAVASTEARALAISIVVLPRARAKRAIRELRDALPGEVELWVGGAGAADVELPERTVRISSLTQLERVVEPLRVR